MWAALYMKLLSPLVRPRGQGTAGLEAKDPLSAVFRDITTA